MSRFGHVLRRVEAQLEAPEPERSQILLEMARNLEDLYAAYRERGIGEAEAERRAERLLGASPEAVEALAGIHASGVQRLIRRLSPGSRHRVERILLGLLSLGSAAVALSALIAAGLLRSPTLFHWLLLALGVVVAATAAATGLRRPRPTSPASRPAPAPLAVALPGLAGVAGAVGGLGAGMELLAMTAAAGAADDWEAALVMVSVGRAAELLALSMVIGLVALLAWVQVARRRREAVSWWAEVSPLLTRTHRTEMGS